MLVQPNDKIVVVGYWDKRTDPGQGIAIGRFLPNGAVDQTFGVNGVVGIDFGRNITADAEAALLQPDGKILAVGASSGASGIPAPLSLIAMRYLPDGSTPLTLVETGTGIGNVDSLPLGINCGTGGNCRAQFKNQSTVTLTAHPNRFVQVSWPGACLGHPLSCNVKASPGMSRVQVTLTRAKVCLVPRVAGKLLAVAKTTLLQSGCLVGLVTTRASSTVAAGRVISVKPTAGMTYPLGTKVAIVVSKGASS